MALLDAETVAGLRALESDSEPGLLKTLCETFTADAEKRFAAMKTALAEDKADVAGREAHALKSSSASLGALGMSTLCKEFEAIAKEGRPAAELVPLLARIETEWPALKTELQRELV